MGFFKEILPQQIHEYLMKIYSDHFARHYIKSYSQEGEDLILKRLFEGKKNGVYVDVGAYHPKRFSNTYLFYLKGWNGINIEPRPGSSKLFNKIRPRDINLEFPVSDENSELIYYLFNEPALNGFSKNLSDERDGTKGARVIAEVKLHTRKLGEILDEYLPKNTEIDFLSIDTEGLDYKVLNSNNWGKYKPKIILLEDLDFNFNEVNKSKAYLFLIERGYELIGKTVYTLFFRLKS
jgi:FkbM family methyltransferase